MVKISDASYENEIHVVDSPYNEDSKIIIFLAREALIFGEGRPENLEKMAKKQGNLLLCELGSVNYYGEYWPLLPGNNVFALLLFFCVLDQIIC